MTDQISQISITPVPIDKVNLEELQGKKVQIKSRLKAKVRIALRSSR